MTIESIVFCTPEIVHGVHTLVCNVIDNHSVLTEFLVRHHVSLWDFLVSRSVDTCHQTQINLGSDFFQYLDSESVRLGIDGKDLLNY